jgi:ATP-dependent RNA helicase DDX27
LAVLWWLDTCGIFLQYLPEYIHVALAVGGLDMKKQERELREMPDIVIATPGRLLDHIQNTPSFGLGRIEVLVLDEADRMLDEFFAEQVIPDCDYFLN